MAKSNLSTFGCIYIFPTKHMFLQHTFWLGATIIRGIIKIKTLTMCPENLTNTANGDRNPWL